MSTLKTTVDQVIARIPAVKGRGEEAAKQALVLPIIAALGYDIWNPDEVRPEYGADFVLSKRNGQQEKVDYAIVINDAPRIFIEAKSLDVSLDDPAATGQLARYFNSTTTVTLGILTNGLEWRFYTDCTQPNMMDSRPFHVSKLDAIDQGLEVFDYFIKSSFNPESIRKLATDILFTAKISEILKRELDLQDRDPSEALVRWVLGQEEVYTESRVTAAVVDRFRPIVKNGLTSVYRSIVRRSLTAMDSAAGEKIPPPPAVTLPPDPQVIPSFQTGIKIKTTEDELKAFAVIKGVFDTNFNGAQIFDPSQRKMDTAKIDFKDTEGYFGVYINKPAWWICRIVLETKTKWVGFDFSADKIDQARGLIPTNLTVLESSAMASLRVQVNSADDLHVLRDVIMLAIKSLLDSKPRS